MTNFYVLKPEEGIRFSRKWAYADQVDPVHRGEAPHCPVCDGYVGGLEWLPPHRIKLSSAKPEKWGDFVWGAGFLLLVSERFKKAYESEGLSGILEFSPPVDVVRVGRKKTGDIPPNLPTYHLIKIVWNGANQDDVMSELIHEKPEQIKCQYCRIGGAGRKQKGIFIEEGSWIGADIFTPRGAPVRIMVSERFKEMVDKHKLKNAWLIPAENYAYDSHKRGLWYVRE